MHRDQSTFLPLFRRLAVGGLLALAVSGPSLAQTAAPDAAATASETKLVSSGWTLGCKPEPRAKRLFCEAAQTIAVAKSRDTLLAVYVTPLPGDDGKADTVLRFQLPHGIDIPAGIRIRTDEGPEQVLAPQTSNQAGLFARAELTDSLAATLKKGAIMTVSFTAVNGNKLSIPVSLDGFSAVFAKLL